MLLLVGGIGACANDFAEQDLAGDSTGEADGTQGEASPTDGPEGVNEDPTVAGHCEYVSPFTQAEECRDYVGEDWTDDEIRAECEQRSGTLTLQKPCDTNRMLGRCILDESSGRSVEIVAYGDDSGACADQKFGCETFGGGRWEPAAICEGDPDPEGGAEGNVFIPPTLECRDPIAGEPVGRGPGGQVCTWQSTSASTEAGRNFDDYASCDVVRNQRPYAPVPPAPSFDDNDPRMDDPAYVAELDWVKEQLRASSCVCCHSTDAPHGPSNWYLEQDGNFMNGFYDSGLAMGSGWIDSSSFGAYEPEENNGFDRTVSGMPSTEPERMRDFFRAELEFRGRSEADFEGATPFGGPLYTQRVYEPTACENGEGVQRDGTIVWEGGDARYIYVLDAGSENPTVPPNLDTPEGTRWRIDVLYTDDPVASGSVNYAELPDGLVQKIPIDGPPAALEPGQTYYLYVTRDVIAPITRCLFTY